jgi:hypothetical protein
MYLPIRQYQMALSVIFQNQHDAEAAIKSAVCMEMCGLP